MSSEIRSNSQIINSTGPIVQAPDTKAEAETPTNNHKQEISEKAINPHSLHTAELQPLQATFAAIVYNNERENPKGFKNFSKNEKYINQQWLNNCENIQLAA